VAAATRGGARLAIASGGLGGGRGSGLGGRLAHRLRRASGGAATAHLAPAVGADHTDAAAVGAQLAPGPGTARRGGDRRLVGLVVVVVVVVFVFVVFFVVFVVVFVLVVLVVVLVSCIVAVGCEVLVLVLVLVVLVVGRSDQAAVALVAPVRGGAAPGRSRESAYRS